MEQMPEGAKLLILGVGAKGNDPARAVRIALLVAKALGAEFDLSEANELIVHCKRALFCYEAGGKLWLTAKGLKAYADITAELKAKGDGDVVELLTALENVSTLDLFAMTSFLFPEEGEADEEVKARAEELREKGVGRFKIKRKGSNITIEEL